LIRGITRTQLAAAAVCTLALSVDTVEIALGNVLSTVFSAPPYLAKPRDLSWVLSSVFVGAAVGAPVFGWAARRFGTRRCLASALVFLAVTSVLAACAPSLGWLGAMRLLSGISVGAIPPLLIAYLAVLAPPQHRGLVIFWVSGIAALAPPAALFAVRALLATGEHATTGWRWALGGAGLLALIAGWLFTKVPELEGSPSSQPIARRDEDSLASARRRFVPLAFLYFLLPWATVGFPLLTGPLLLQRGYDLSRALLYVALSTVGPAISPLVAGTIIDRFSRRASLTAATVVMFGALALFIAGRAPATTMAALVAFGMASSLYLALLTTYAAESFSREARTTVTSIAWAINRVASVIAPIALLLLVQPGSDFLTLWPVGVALICSLFFIFLSRPTTKPGEVVD